MIKKISEKKRNLINNFYNNTTIQVGEEVEIVPADFTKYGSNRSELFKVEKIEGDVITIKYNNHFHEVKKSLVKTRYTEWKIGANPFIEKYRNIKAINFTLDSIVFQLELFEKRREKPYDINGIPIKEVNWNPFIYDENGNKMYYQRGFVWSTEQNQRLIESIYKGINCGVVLIRRRGWNDLKKMQEKGETELYFNDIVDGKQRLHAIKLFLNDEYPDFHGNYYSDLSNYSQLKFGDNQLIQFAEMDETSTDEETLYQFLKMNHEGVPQSKEHLDFVASLLKEKQS